MTDYNHAFKAHKDLYRCIGINIAHLNEEDKQTIDCCYSHDMAAERETGWFVKLYELDEDLAHLGLERYYRAAYEDITPNLLTIFCAAYEAGYRMIEFDIDALVVDGLPVFEDVDQ